MSILPKRSPLVRPEYVIQAAKRKYKTSSRSIHGAFEFDVKWFWSVGSLVALRIDPPTVVGRYFVDVEVKEVINNGSQPKEVEINTLHAQSQEKTYRLSQSRYAVFGGNLIGCISADFFQMAPIKLSSVNFEGTTLRLSKGYGSSCKVLLPPMSKVTATITTRAIAYQASTLVQVTFPRYADIGIRHKSCLGLFTVTGDLSPREVLAYNGVEDLKVTESQVSFQEPRTLSYMGEVVEMNVSEPLPIATMKM